MLEKLVGALRGGGHNIALGAGAIENSVKEMINLSKGKGVQEGFKAVSEALHTPKTDGAKFLKGMFSGATMGAGIGAAAGVAKGGYDYYNGKGTLGGIVSNAAMGGIAGGLAGGAFRALKPAGKGWISSNSAFNQFQSNSAVMRGYNKLPAWARV